MTYEDTPSEGVCAIYTYTYTYKGGKGDILG